MPNGTISAIAAFTLTVSAALASGAGIVGAPDDNELATLTESEASTHARLVFHRADLDRSGGLSADEFTALSVVTAELAHLNGYFVIEGEGDRARPIMLPINAPSALAPGERVRVEAVSRNTFFALAGDDGVLSEGEFVGAQSERFREADRNNNGALARSELKSFAVGQARLAAGA